MQVIAAQRVASITVEVHFGGGELRPTSAKAGDKFEIAIFGINRSISVAPPNFVSASTRRVLQVTASSHLDPTSPYASLKRTPAVALGTSIVSIRELLNAAGSQSISQRRREWTRQTKAEGF